MEQKQDKSPGSTFDPVISSDICISGCPFLGLEEDPRTSLAYPDKANHCHRLGMALRIDLAHQGGFCLSDNYSTCEVHGQVEELPDSAQTSKAGLTLPVFAFALPALKERLPFLERGQYLLVQSLSSFRESLPSADREKGLPSLAQSLPELKQRLLKLKRDFVVPEINRSALSSIRPKDFGLKDLSLKQQNVGLVALPVMLLLILLAAVIWWPPLGESQRDATALGASVPAETLNSAIGTPSEIVSTDGRTDEQAENNAASIDKPVALGLQPTNIETDVGTAVEVSGVEEQEAMAETAAKPPVLEEQPQLGAIEAAESAAEEPAEAETIQDNVETVHQIIMHRTPGEDGEFVGVVTDQQEMNVLGRDESSDWLLVRLESGIAGWVNAAESETEIVVSELPVVQEGLVPEPEVVEPVVSENSAHEVSAESTAGVGTAVINTGALNLRSGPGVEHDIVAVAYNREQVSLIEQPLSSGWVLVRLANGQEGWLNSKYAILNR